MSSRNARQSTLSDSNNFMKARVIAFYLPQYHPIPENDEWWGKGFTEWQNVVKAKPLFKGHYEPKIPTELGFYDLRMPEIREEQAKLAKEAGVEGFCYWHYWLGNGKQLLERPFNEVLHSGNPDFPFCLSWANTSWLNSTWTRSKSHKKGNNIIVEQLYPGEDDYRAHFHALLPAFKDKRYICVDGKPLFVIYSPETPEIQAFIDVWRKLAVENGLKGFHFVAIARIGSLKDNLDAKDKIAQLLSFGFDAVNTWSYTLAETKCNIIKKYLGAILSKWANIHMLTKYKQSDINRHLYIDEDCQDNVYPLLFPNWDCSPRRGRACSIYTESTPAVFSSQIETVLELVKNKASDHRIVFLKSWNEWGEGNYVEPDVKYGRGYLDALKKHLF